MGAEEDQLDVVVVGSCITDFIRYVKESVMFLFLLLTQNFNILSQLCGEFTSGQ